MTHTLIDHDADPDHHDDHPVQHLSVADYAAMVGLSTATVRRRIRSGELAAVRVDGPYGPEWRIPANTTHPDQPRRSPSTSDAAYPDRHDDHPMQQGSDPALVALIERQQQTIMELSGRLGFYQARIQTLEEQVRQLTAPAEVASNVTGNSDPATETAQDTTPPTNGHHSASERLMRPWWRFFRWLTQPV